jgi:hypothetical protein
MTHPQPDLLSNYLDGELPPGDARMLEAHLAACPVCTTLLAELRRVVARAQALEDRPPRVDLWPGVAAAIGSAPWGRRRIALSMPQLLAAGVATMLLSGGTVGLLLRGPATAPRAVASADLGDTGRALVRITEAGVERGYDAAIRRLEGELVAGRGRLDSATVRMVEDKLRLIDHAILEAERALAADPANAYLNGHLTQTRLRKLELLRRVAALTRAVS